MKAKSALSLAVVAGVAASATAGTTPANRDLVPLRKAGVMYINMQTGERSLTLYELGSNVPEVDVSHSTAALFDWWMSIDENPCWEDSRADGFGFNVDATTDTVTQPVVGWDYGDMPFDSKITGVVLNTAVLANETVDSNGDGTLDTGIDTIGVYYDALSDGARSSNQPPTAAVRIESIPGNRLTPGGTTFSDYDLVLDFGGDHFEMGDSDGANLGALWLPGAASGYDFSSLISECTTTTGGLTTCTVVSNSNADGLADIQYLQYYTQHGTDDKVTANSTYLGLACPEGSIAFSTFAITTITICTTPSGGTVTCTITTTVTSTIYTPDPLPQGQVVRESFGFGTLGPGADTTNIDSTIGGCCFWYGGVDCVGFLDQLQAAPDIDPGTGLPYEDGNATWYEFNPFAQFGMGFLSDSGGPNPCDDIDYNGDTVLDNGDIGAFVQLFLQQDLATDLNGDGVVDNGDIGAFVALFLSCTG